jgi:hypothetical protein
MSFDGLPYCRPADGQRSTHTRCRFKIVVYAQDGWIWGAVPCDVEPFFLDFDAHALDCDPTMP